jgi:hypothetical protein
MWWLIGGIILLGLLIAVLASRASRKTSGSTENKGRRYAARAATAQTSRKSSGSTENKGASFQEISKHSTSYGSSVVSQGGYDANSNGPYGQSSQSGVDYPSSWYGPNEPGGSLDI